MRLLSYNIHKGIGGRDRRYDFGRIRQVVETANPDLLCLQEVDRNVPRSSLDDQPRQLADLLHAEGTLYQLNVHVRKGGYGNLLLSRWPFRSHHNLSLRLGSRKPRGAQVVVIDTPEGPIRLVNWHLGLAEPERQWQVDHLLNHRLFREADHLPTLIAGDTNDWRERLTAAVLSRHGFRQLTWPRSRFRTFPAYMPLSALDKVFARGPIDVQAARVYRTRTTRQASDHLPLVVDFHLPAPPASS